MMLTNPALRFFISSTTADLAPVRNALYEAIWMAGHIPLGMEVMPVTHKDSAASIEEEIEACDIYVGIVGGMFGSTMPDPEDEKVKISYTQFEFRTAARARKPMLIFLMKSDDYKRYRRNLPPEDLDLEFDKELEGFRAEVKRYSGENNRFISYFPYESKEGISHTETAIYKKLLAGIPRLSKSLPNCGLVPVESLESTRFVSGHMRSNPALMNVLSTFKKYELLNRRCGTTKQIKESMANYFWDHFYAALTTKKYKKIFFESGSSLIYVARSFIDRMLKDKRWKKFREECESTLNLTTNNILIYLEIFLTTDIQIALWPQGKPDDKFGATFGDISELVSPGPGQGPPDPEEERAVVDRLIAEVEVSEPAIEANPSRRVLLLGASGIYYDTNHPHAGPHVGDYSNSVFKRVMLRSDNPIVFFIDDKKISTGIDYGRRYAVCEKNMHWTDLLKEKQLALCVGSSSLDGKRRVLHTLAEFGFPFTAQERPQREYPDCLPFLVCNERFKETFPITWIDAATAL